MAAWLFWYGMGHSSFLHKLIRLLLTDSYILFKDLYFEIYVYKYSVTVNGCFLLFKNNFDLIKTSKIKWIWTQDIQLSSSILSDTQKHMHKMDKLIQLQ